MKPSLLLLFFVLGVCGILADDREIPINRVVLLDSPSFVDYSATLSSRQKEAHRAPFKAFARQQHDAVMTEVKGIGGEDAKLYDFHHVARGFLASLTDTEAEIMSARPDVLFVSEDTPLELQTTRTPDFLGLTNVTAGLWKKTKGTNSIIGIIDSGIWPESVSFSDAGYGKVPKSFRGKCVTNNDKKFKCNKKLIGARYFGSGVAAMAGESLAKFTANCSDYLSPRDSNGHGTHVASIAAGNAATLSINGVAFGTARGMAPGARLSVYKASWCSGNAAESDVAMAIETAVADGVDVLSISLGFSQEYPGLDTQSILSYFAYKATLANVPVVFAAGNSGPTPFTVGNGEPWSMAVAASTVDRRYASAIALGNGQVVKGLAFKNVGTPGYAAGKKYSLVFGQSVPSKGADSISSGSCAPGAIDPSRVKGRIVVCMSQLVSPAVAIAAVQSAKGAGVIIYEIDSSIVLPGFYSFPAAIISVTDAQLLINYASKAKSPVATMYPSKLEEGTKSLEAPQIAFYSSAGPNRGAQTVLKPDIAAPGDNIFGAWSSSRVASGGSKAWQVASGTSAACPHVAGVIALLKLIHPNFSPSELFSAVITSASTRTNRNNAIRVNEGNGVASPLNMGAGQISPNTAASPGLVYPITSAGYDQFICSPEAYLRNATALFKPAKFCSSYPSTRTLDMNTPTVVLYNARARQAVRTTRTVKNVQGPGTFFVSVVAPKGASVAVSPRKLTFKGQEWLSYSVTVVPAQASASVKGAVVAAGNADLGDGTNHWTFGSISWYDNRGHNARITVAVNAV